MSLVQGQAQAVKAYLTRSVVIGFGCGLATVTVPLYLAEIAPPSIKKSLGIANQFFIVIGILIGQSLSFPFAKELEWRWVLAVGSGIAVLQLVGSFYVPEPTKEVVHVHDEQEPLLPSDNDQPSLTIKELLASKDKAVSRGCKLSFLGNY